MTRTCAYASGAAARSAAPASTTDRHQSSGFCSTRPGAGWLLTTGTRVSSTRVAPDHNAGFGRAGPEVEREDRHAPARARTILANDEKSSRP